MKYGIERPLPASEVDLAQRFHVAVMHRMYELQEGAAPHAETPLDVAITAMWAWSAPDAPAAVGLEAFLREEFARSMRGEDTPLRRWALETTARECEQKSVATPGDYEWWSWFPIRPAGVAVVEPAQPTTCTKPGCNKPTRGPVFAFCRDHSGEPPRYG